MGLKDRLLRAKCSAGFHSGEWEQIASGSCDEQRTCVHCAEVSARTDHHMAGWAYADDPAVPACLKERRCQRCPLVEQEIQHTMQWTYVHPVNPAPESGWAAVKMVMKGRAEQCRQGNICNRCGFTDGKTIIRHVWDLGTDLPVEIGRHPKRVYTCEICGAEDVRNKLLSRAGIRAIEAVAWPTSLALPAGQVQVTPDGAAFAPL
jgi:hypothetical protein